MRSPITVIREKIKAAADKKQKALEAAAFAAVEQDDAQALEQLLKKRTLRGNVVVSFWARSNWQRLESVVFSKSEKIAAVGLAEMRKRGYSEREIVSIVLDTDNVAMVRKVSEWGVDVKQHASYDKAKSVAVAKTLYDLGLDVNAVDPKTGETPIMKIEKNAKIYDFLLSNGAKTDVVDKKGFTVWYYAANDLGMLKVALNHGMDVNAMTNKHSGQTILMSAAHGDSDCLDLLIKLGADVKAKDNKGGNALHYAATQDGGWNVSTLYYAGCPPIQDNNGDYPSDIAVGCLSGFHTFEQLLDYEREYRRKQEKEAKATTVTKVVDKSETMPDVHKKVNDGQRTQA